MRRKLDALRSYTRKLFPRIPRLVRMCERRSLLRRNTREIIVRTDQYLTASQKLLTKFHLIEIYQSFLNEPQQLQQQTENMIADLEAVIARIDDDLARLDSALRL